MTVVINGTNGVTNVNGTAAAPAITGTDTDSGMYFGTNTVAIATGGTAAVTVDSGGDALMRGYLRAGDGVTTTGAIFGVDGGGTLAVGATSGDTVIRGAVGTGTSNRIVFAQGSGGNIQGLFDASGNFSISSGSLTVGGTATQIISLGTYNSTTATAANMVVASNGAFYRSTSALKYKQDVRDIESIDITKLRPVRYKSKCDIDDQTKDHFGIVADEVDQAGIPELVNYGADGEVEGFQYERLTVVLLKAIQELKAEIDQLKAK